MRADMRIGMTVAVALGAMAASCEESWRIVNAPGIGGAMQAMACHPANPDVMYGTIDMGAVFKTTDGGRNWTMLGIGCDVNPGLGGAYSVMIDPNAPETVWTASAEVYKSTDGGATWKCVSPRDNRPDAFYHRVAVDPLDSRRVYAITHYKFSSRPHVLVTADGGATWRAVRPDGADTPAINDVVCSARVPGLVYLGTAKGVWVSRDAGATWAREGSVPAANVWRIAAAGGRVACGVKDGGVWTGLDAVAPGWAPAPSQPREIQKGQLALTVDARGRILVGRKGTGFPIWRSDAACATWETLYNPRVNWIKGSVPAAIADYLKPGPGDINWFHIGAASRDAFDLCLTPWTPGISEIIVSPVDAKRVYVSNNAGIFYTNDDGGHWLCAGCELGKPLPGDRWKGADAAPSDHTHSLVGHGLNLIVPQEASFDPYDPNAMAVAYHDIGLRRTRDDGASSEWLYDNKTMLRRDTLNSNVALYHPHQKGVMFYGATDLYRSDDNGVNWTRVHVRPAWKALDDFCRAGGTCHSKLRVWKARIDPFGKPDETRLLVSVTADGGYSSAFDKTSAYRPGGIFLSEDGGAAWTQLTNGLSAAVRGDELLFDPYVKDRLWLGANRSSGGADGLYRSDDRGRTWRQLGAGHIGAVRENCLAIGSGALYVVAYEPGRNGFWDESVLWRSRDAGETWERIEKGFISSVAVSPLDDAKVFVAKPRGFVWKAPETFGVFRSTDAGRTWQRLGAGKLLPFKSRMRLEIDPKYPDRLKLYSVIGLWIGTGV